MSQTAAGLPNVSDESLSSQFVELADSIARIGRQCGVQIVPYRNKSLPFFSKISLESQRKVIAKMGTLQTIYLQTFASIGSFDHRTLIWTALKHFNLQPPSDFFDKVSSEDVVEIYDDQNVQLFSNLKFFDLCSYTLEEVNCMDWPELWDRDEKAFQEVLEAVRISFSESVTNTVPLAYVPHIITERRSALQLQLKYEMTCIAPAWNRSTKKKEAFIAVERGIILNPPSIEKEEAFLRQQNA